MKQLKDHVKYAVKGPVLDNGKQYVLIEHDGKQFTRLIHHKAFSNFPIEFIHWNNTTYQVNNLKNLY